MAGLYIHIPYCHSKCYYCDFYSGSGLGRHTEYVESIFKEFTLRHGEIDEHFTTVYIGGGTPSSLTCDELGHLLSGINRMVDISRVSEFTVEVNPEDVSERLLTLLSRYGVNRVSMGVQSLVDSELKSIGRRHTAATVLEAARLISRYFSNFSYDLIFGLPGQTADTLSYSLEALLELRPPHISVYLLSYEPGTRLYARLMTGKVEEASEETACHMYEMITGRLRDAGYVHYEISNFALPGMEAKHNSLYWNYTPYLGLGASAHSFDGYVRRSNPVNLNKYIDGIGQGGCVAEVETEDDSNRFNDYVITRLRTMWGMDIDELSRYPFGHFVDEVYPVIERMVSSGLLVRTESRIAIPECYWLTCDNILREIIV